MNKRTIRTKKIWSMLVAAVLIVSAVTPVVAATARATTMKLEKTEGTVTLKTQNGTSRKPTNGMRLLNGNTLETAASSYAHISLDSSKAVKLDQKTSTTVRQSGKQLELLVKSGQLFFNVSEKLTQKESLNIRTSSMVAGIRGTCGVVEKVNPSISKLYLIEGKVTLGYGENATTIYGGQTATVVLRPKDETGESGGSDDNGNTEKDMEQKVYVDKLTEANVPIFAITEILSNPVLQQKIEETTELEIKKLEEVLEESQNPEGTEEKKEEEQKQEETTSSGGSYGGGVSDSSSGSGTGDVAGPVEPVIEEINLSKYLEGADAINAINEAWEKGASAVTVSGNIVNADGEETPLDLIDVPENKELIVDGDATINGVTVAADGKLTVNGRATINGVTVRAGGTLTNNEGAALTSNQDIVNNGTIINNGTIGVIEKTITLASGSELQNKGQISSTNITMETGSTFTNSDSVTGEFELKDGSTLTNSGTMEALNNKSWDVGSATIDNNTGTINMGTGTILVTGKLNLSSVGTITGSGNAVISLNENGALTLGSVNSSGGSISNTSTENSHYTIAVSDGSTITWNDTRVTISTGTTDIGNTIQNLIDEDEDKVITQNENTNNWPFVDSERNPADITLLWNSETGTLSRK